MTQLTISALIDQAERLGLRHGAGPVGARPVERVDVTGLDRIDEVPAGTLVIVPEPAPPAPYRLDVALRRAGARDLAGIVFPLDLNLPETACTLADRGEVAVLTAPGARPADLAMAVDRLLSGGAHEAMTRAGHAIEQATAAAAVPRTTPAEVLAVAGRALGVDLTLAGPEGVTWSAPEAVCIGEIPIGRVEVAGTTRAEPATGLALPVLAALLSRVAQREIGDRFAPTQSRADLIVELVLAEPARVDALTGRAARLGLPLHLSHVVAWLIPTGPHTPQARVARSVRPALELFTLQFVADRPELWHVAFVQDDVLLVSTEEHGAGDHQRRLREVAVRIQEYAAEQAGSDWQYTLGLGTPQTGGTGLRSSAAQARMGAETAIAAGRAGSVALTDVTGLHRMLLDVYASPTSRALLADLLHPLDELGPQRSTTAVETLLAYLAHRNSLAHAGRQLNLHPNAVGYRLRRIRERLSLDLDDPDIRFALELACRVRLLGAGKG